MAADRLLPVSTTPGAITGDDYMDAVQEEVTGLWNTARVQATNVAGTNAITFDYNPPLTAGILDGMGVLVRPIDDNTGAVTFNGDPCYAADGTSVIDEPGSLLAGRTYDIVWNSGANAWIVLNLPGEPSRTKQSPGFRNVAAANGGFGVWQRGDGASSIFSVPASTTQYTADRWYLSTGVNQAYTVSPQLISSLTTVLSRYTCLIQRNAGQTGVGPVFFGYPLTSDEISRLKGSKVSLQFKIRTGANWSGVASSPATGTLSYKVRFGTGAETKGVSGFTGESSILDGSVTAAIGAGTVSYSGLVSTTTVPYDATQGEILFYWTPSGTAGADDSFQISDVQLEIGTASSPFELIPFEVALHMCQSHFTKTYNYSTAPGSGTGRNALGSINHIGGVTSPDTFQCFWWVRWQFPVVMRKIPTITTWAANTATAGFWRNITTNTEIASIVDGDTGGGDSAANIYSGSFVGTIHQRGYIQAQADSGI